MPLSDAEPLDLTEDRLDIVPLARAALWGGAAAFSVLVAVLAARSETGARRIAEMIDGSAAPPAAQSVPSPAAPQRDDASESERREQAETVRALKADHERLLERLEAIERSLGVTGSVPATPPATPQPAQRAEEAPPRSETSPEGPTVTRTAFGLDLGSGPTLEALRSLWRTIRAQHGAVVEGLRPVVVVREDPEGGVTELRLVAGPLANAADAARLCAVVGATGRACRPAVFDGQRLALR